MSGKQAKRDAEAVRQKERDAMFPPSDSGSSGSDNDVAIEDVERIASASMRAARKMEAETKEKEEQEKLKVCINFCVASSLY